MIIETRGDVVHLSGSLHKNQWMSIRAAANLLLHDHPQGIIVDCAGLENISEDGARTFLEAMRDIESARARIIVASLPQNVLTVIKTVPGVRSQLPIAASVEAARASLKVQRRAPDPAPHADATRSGQVILVPLMAEVDLTYGADLAARLARVAKAEVRLVYLLEVTRTLPLNAPLHGAGTGRAGSADQSGPGRQTAERSAAGACRTGARGHRRHACRRSSRILPRRSSSGRPSTRWITAAAMTALTPW